MGLVRQVRLCARPMGRASRRRSPAPMPRIALRRSSDRSYARGSGGILPAVAWFPGVGRRMVAMIAAVVLLVLVALGYVLLRVRAAGHDHAADRRLGSDKQAYKKWGNGVAAGPRGRPAVGVLEP